MENNIIKEKETLNETNLRNLKDVVIQEMENNLDATTEELAAKLKMKKTTLLEYIYWDKVEKVLGFKIKKSKAVQLFVFVKENKLRQMREFYELNKELSVREFKMLVEHYKITKEILSIETFKRNNVLEYKNENNILKPIKVKELKNRIGFSYKTLEDILGFERHNIPKIISGEITPSKLENNLLRLLISDLNNFNLISDGKKINVEKEKIIMDNVKEEKIEEKKIMLELSEKEYDLIMQKRKYTEENFIKLRNDFLDSMKKTFKLVTEIKEWLVNYDDNEKFYNLLSEHMNEEIYEDLLETAEEYYEN